MLFSTPQLNRQIAKLKVKLDIDYLYLAILSAKKKKKLFKRKRKYFRKQKKYILTSIPSINPILKIYAHNRLDDIGIEVHNLFGE